MIYFIHRDPKFDKQLAVLQGAGGKAAVAARRAEAVIGQILAKGLAELVGGTGQTKHGEARIRNCIKYEMGNGYRLISVRQGRHLFLLYIGSHDECDRWLNNNRGFKPMPDHEENVAPLVVELADQSPVSSAADEPAAADADQLTGPINDKLLRRIFRGLCGEEK